MKKIEEYKIKSKKYRKISLILIIPLIIFIILITTLKTELIIIGLLGLIIIGSLIGKYNEKHKELENKIEYMKIHEEIINDFFNNYNVFKFSFMC